MAPVFRSVLAATDLEAGSDAAIVRAHEIARACEASLGVVVATPVLGRSMPLEEARKRLEDHVRAVTERDPDGFSAFTEVGPAAPAILDVAKRFGADIVVIGRKPTHDQQRLGSVALRVVRDSPCPVLVTRDRFGSGPVVAAVDLGKGSTEVVRIAAELARRHKAALDVVHVIDFGRSEVLLALSAFFGGSMPPAADETGIVALALAALESELAATGSKGAASIIKGDPKHEVLARAATLGASLLVVGATAHPLLTRLGLGSVADAAVRGAAASVLVVRRASEV